MDKKKLSILIVVLVAVLGIGGYILAGSLGDSKPVEESKPVEKVEEPKIVYTNPLTGEESEKEYPARPLVVSIDNVGDAIPQSWLSKADLVYEFPVEGNQSRLQAIYYGEFPEEFGPIRSTRPYFVDLTREYKGIFLAHGWSPAAKEYLMSDVVPYINAMNSDCSFYRVDDKYAPHNSYIKWSEVKEEIEEEGWWDEKQEIRPFKFLKKGKESAGKPATYIEINYPASPCEYTYDAEKNRYIRTIFGGTKYIDKETGYSVKTKNVLVQYVSSYAYDYKGRLEIDMCAGGEAMLFTGGKVIKGTWSRDNLDARTIFVDEEGNEFKLTVGSTWVEVVDQNCTVYYDGPEEESSEDDSDSE